MMVHEAPTVPKPHARMLQRLAAGCYSLIVMLII